jgi:hypothetical protein
MKFFEKIVFNMPFRMILGKFGICLIKIGRQLQIRHANWNHEFKLQFDNHCLEDWGEFHVSEPLITVQELSFNSSASQMEKQTNLVRRLFAIRGVKKVLLQPYEITVVRAQVFDWDELRPQIPALRSK